MRQWESRHGNYLLQGQEAKGSIQQSGGDITEEDARKIFKFIDYNEARVVSKHQIRLLILYQKYINEGKAQTEVMRRLVKMLLVTELNVFDENLFAFFFCKKQPNQALRHPHLT